MRECFDDNISFENRSRRTRDHMTFVGIVGAWVGDCPTCREAVVFADPAMSAALTPMQRLCPLCTALIEMVRDKFIAIPGTGAPTAPVAREV